jgi:hypothetical protein
MLYYPLVQPPQTAVHQALLYWDGIASLVPGDSAVQNEAVSSELRDLQDRHLYHPITLEEEYRGLLRQATAGLPALADALIEISGRQIPRDWILSYNGKWNDAEILSSLVDLGLAQHVPNSTSFKSLAMPREVVTLLTATMAHEVARSSSNRAYTPYTDQQTPDQVALGCDPNTGVAAWRVKLGQLLPTPSPATTTQQILEFRESGCCAPHRKCWSISAAIGNIQPTFFVEWNSNSRVRVKTIWTQPKVGALRGPRDHYTRQ